MSPPESRTLVSISRRSLRSAPTLTFTTATACLTPKTTCSRFSGRSAKAALLTVSYAGNEGHHLLVLVPANLGNPALCLSLSQPSEVAPGSCHLRTVRRRCRLYVGIGQNLPRNARRPGAELWIDHGAKDDRQFELQRPRSESRINAGKRGSVLVGYTYSKSIDEASNLGEQINPFNASLTRVISSWDMTHNFVATYTYALPFDRFFDATGLPKDGACPAPRASAPDSQ